MDPGGRNQEPYVAFENPWHAQLFAITHKLVEGGLLTWSEWTEHFSAHLKATSDAGAPKDGSAHYDVWLETLESLLVARGVATDAALMSVKDAWADAYRATPHGKPVALKR